ncbi:HTH-type transcriptional regulator GntR [Aquimixticola soesokkakensis]|uniref:HTH-type transcriptional regulator GntR n=1 Tax=Aquimixticola soesokkakensis TaxID=1519096 RepID=A0A1Y5TM71_9RHOB|nr:LacI family DNA-binding transcriptional regulator [Aquimixticola soesokkakensis]SLN63462.1 HTH-type transcriptional regulator GntR [Aquimixticola soesokkakensis]
MSPAKRHAKVKMTDIAQAVGVSAMTVSRAFKGDTGVKPATRAAVLSKAEELGYVFDATAANLRQSRTGFVAVVVPSLENANFSATVRALSKALSQKNIQILLANTEYDVEEEERLIPQLLRRNPEAIVLIGTQHSKRTRALLKKAPVPVIEIWDLPREAIGHVVGFSNFDAVQLLVAHLVKSGRRRLGFLGGEAGNDPRGQQRRAGFVAALAQLALPAHRLVPLGTAPVGMTEGAAGLDRLLSQFPDTDGIICVSDLVGFGAVAQCARRGIAVPETLAIAGFGNYEIGRVCEPALTTVDVGAEQIGQRTAELVFDLLAPGNTRQGPRRFDIHPDLIVRRSTP